MQYLTLVNQGYAALLGLDSAKPMHEQESYVSGVSWEQFFLGSGVDEFHQYAAMATMAEEAGFSLPQQDEERIQDILKNMPEDAKNYGFDSVDAFIQASFGSGVRLEDYEHFIRQYFLAMSYENSIFESVEPSDDDRGLPQPLVQPIGYHMGILFAGYSQPSWGYCTTPLFS